MALAECDHALEEPENILICLQLAPVQPSRRIVLVIRIIVTELCIQEFVSGPEHRGSVRDQEDGEEILDLLLSQPHHFRWHNLIAFPSTVPA